MMMMMGGSFNPGAEAENQGKVPNNPLPLQHCQGAIGYLPLRWLLGSPPLGIEPYPISN